MKFTVKKVANMVFLSSECGVIFNSWYDTDFTERKLKNAMRKIQNELNGNAVFTRAF